MSNIIITAIQSINSEAQVSVSGDDINTITWENGTTPIPLADIEAAILKVKAHAAATAYIQKRVDAYAELGEQLDQLYHDMAADKGDKTGEWFKAVKKVKDDNPK